MRVLVTGHLGYVGVIMTRVLRDAGHTVVGLDTGYYDGCDLSPVTLEVPVIKRDIRDVSGADLAGFDGIVHLAALSNDPLGHLNPELTYDINLHATLRLAQLAKQAGVARFVFASSCSLYGASGTDDALDETAPTAPLTPYATSKIDSETELMALASDDFSPVFMRNATCYGASPRLRADVVVNNLVCWAVVTGKVRLQSDGRSWRPLLHVEDMSRAFAEVLTAPRDAIHNQAFNVGRNEENYLIRNVAEIVRETVPNCDVAFAEEASADPRSYRVDFTKLESALPGLEFSWTVRRGAQEVYEAVIDGGMTQEIFLGRRHIRLNQLQHLLDEGKLDDSLRWT
jgi:nucleoside-diphosphate-sugar epimerase